MSMRCWHAILQLSDGDGRETRTRAGSPRHEEHAHHFLYKPRTDVQHSR
mgnify:CR=1 FL=1